MKNLIMIMALLFAVAITNAQTVYKVPGGKSFHKNKTCMSLSRSTDISAIDSTDVGTLKPCGICYKSQKPDPVIYTSDSGVKYYRGSGGGVYYWKEGQKKYVDKTDPKFQ